MTDKAPRLESGASRGQLIGWAVVALVSAAAIEVMLPMPQGGARVRALHHFYDAGHLLAAGLVSSGVAAAWQRWGFGQRWLGTAAFGAATILVGAFTLSEDVTVLAGKFPGPAFLWRVALVAGVALALPVLAAIARWFIDARLGPKVARRSIVAAAGLGMLVAHHLVLQNDYPAVHLYMIWAAAVLLAESARFDVPEALASRRTWRYGAIGVQGAFAVLAAVSLVVRPSGKVALELSRSGAVLAPWVLQAHSAFGDVRFAEGAGEWFVERGHEPAIMPSTPPLVPKNAVVLLFTIDAMRADILVKDAHAKLLPNLSALRRESVDFTQARSPSPQTNASITTLFAGKYFSQLYWSIKPGGIMTIPCAHEDPTPRFPEMLAQGGVDTVTFSGMPGLVNAYGIVKGFKEEEVIPGRPFATAKQITDVALERLRRQGNGPLFLYIHFTDPHAPYDLAGKHGTEFDRYLREVALVDDAIGRFRQAITELAIEDRTTIIVSADHGEAFGEHRTRHHATTVYEELLRVPLMIRVPGVRPRAVRAPVALIDVGPTVLDLMGHPTPRSYMGQSLVPYLRGQDATLDRPLAFESSRHLRAMVFADGFKAILNRKQGTAEVYDLVHDPKELRNLVDEGGVDAQARVDTLRAFFRVHELRRSGYVIPYIR